MSIYMVTNRQRVAGGFSNDRDPDGNSWNFLGKDKAMSDAQGWAPCSKELFLAVIQQEKKPVLVFIHGFNNSWEKGMETFKAIVAALPEFAHVGYFWDSLGSVFDYFQDRGRAEQSAADLLELLQALNCPNVIAHSMGNFLLQTALEKAAASGITQPCIRDVVMVAADVDCDVLNKTKIAQMVSKGLVLYSALDGALIASMEIHGLYPRLGQTGSAGGYPANFSGVNCTTLMPFHFDLVENHSFWFQWPKGYELMRGGLQ